MTTALATTEQNAPATQQQAQQALPAAINYEQAESIAKTMAAKCEGPAYVSVISGRRYPTVSWWTAVGASLGFFPREVSCVRQERGDDRICVYEAVVEVVNQASGQIVGRGSAICSSKEKNWGNRDEYAIRSMAITRATGKAYRLGLAFIAVMAGLEATPSEEMPPQQAQSRPAEQSQQRRTTVEQPAPVKTIEGHIDEVHQVEREGKDGPMQTLDVVIAGDTYIAWQGKDILDASAYEGSVVKVQFKTRGNGERIITKIQQVATSDGEAPTTNQDNEPL